MMPLPTVNPQLALGLAIFTVSTTAAMAPGRRRMWALSGLVTPMLAMSGLRMAASWMAAGAREFYDDYGRCAGFAELMKAYFLVELAYCAFFHWADTPLLDCWLHHLFYIWYLDWLGHTGQTGVLQPFLVMEVPTAIRTVGELMPGLKPLTRPAFLATFIVFRVLWPVWVLTRIWMSAANFAVGIAAITLHCYWAGQMVWRQRQRQQQQPVVPPPGEHY